MIMICTPSSYQHYFIHNWASHFVPPQRYYYIFQQKTLKFDDKEKVVSETAKTLMRGLLEEATHRLTHSGLLQHKFFLHINWNDLRNSEWEPAPCLLKGFIECGMFVNFLCNIATAITSSKTKWKICQLGHVCQLLGTVTIST